MSEIRFVEFIRVSSRQQADRDTPELQLRALAQLSEQRGGRLVERIQEEHVSGTLPLAERPDLLRLHELSAPGGYDELRVYALDRLTRSPDVSERMAVWAMVARAGAVILDTNGRAIDPTDESGFGEMEFYLLSFFAAREAERIRRRTRDGMRRAAARGRPLNGRPPFGYRYDVESGSWSIDEAASPWVRRMFEDCAAGRPSRAITATLAANGVKSTRGGRWHATSVARLVKNRAYLGEYSQTVDGERHEYAIPALVEEALWRRANAALTARSGRPQNAVEVEALCRGVLYCGECGERMQVRTTHRRGVAYVYYQCGSKHPRTLAVNCGSQNHRVAEVDRAVWESVRRIVQDPDLLARAASGPKPAESGDGDRESELRSLLAKVGDREASILDLMDEGLAVQTCKDRLKRLQLERSALNEELDDVRNAAAIHSKSGQVIGLTGWRRSTSGRGSAT